ncbi:type II CAAX prenyl endopeptidase Rce1 family protein [Pyrodictium abyssi]
MAPYRSAPPWYTAAVLAVALAVGVAAGYYRAATGSILLPILIHSIVNLGGIAAVRRMIAAGLGNHKVAA